MGLLCLMIPPQNYVAEFGENGKEDVPVRHLLTHTSGLLDQIPENRNYRESKRPLGDFVTRICELLLSFEPVTRISCQSSEIAVLSEICERVTWSGLAAYLEENLFDPLGLRDTALKISAQSERESDAKIAGEG
jgi:CubicO group peptidase (beta-lactamase class C family)